MNSIDIFNVNLIFVERSLFKICRIMNFKNTEFYLLCARVFIARLPLEVSEASNFTLKQYVINFLEYLGFRSLFVFSLPVILYACQ